jgi:hypothetical protein
VNGIELAAWLADVDATDDELDELFEDDSFEDDEDVAALVLKLDGADELILEDIGIL